MWPHSLGWASPGTDPGLGICPGGSKPIVVGLSLCQWLVRYTHVIQFCSVKSVEWGTLGKSGKSFFASKRNRESHLYLLKTRVASGYVTWICVTHLALSLRMKLTYRWRQTEEGLRRAESRERELCVGEIINVKISSQSELSFLLFAAKKFLTDIVNVWGKHSSRYVFCSLGELLSPLSIPEAHLLHYEIEQRWMSVLI